MFVVVSGDSADVAPSDLALPLVERLVSSQVRVLAVQPARPPLPQGKTGPVAPQFVVALRDDGAVAGRVSTVDNLDDYRGRLAAVLAIGELQTGQTGHYGFGAGARIVPGAPSS